MILKDIKQELIDLLCQFDNPFVLKVKEHIKDDRLLEEILKKGSKEDRDIEDILGELRLKVKYLLFNSNALENENKELRRLLRNRKK